MNRNEVSIPFVSVQAANEYAAYLRREFGTTAQVIDRTVWWDPTTLGRPRAAPMNGGLKR